MSPYWRAGSGCFKSCSVEVDSDIFDRGCCPDVVPCYLQKEPAHKLPNLKDIPVLDVSGEASYHRVFDSCIAKWLNQAGVKTEYVKMEDVGLTGNDHEMMLDKNSDAIAKFFVNWLDKHVH